MNENLIDFGGLLQEDMSENGTHEPQRPVPQTPVYDVYILNRNQPNDWYWHPRAMDRIARFCNEHEEQADVPALIQNLQQSFVLDDPGLIVVVFFRDLDLIGHMLCERALLYHRPIIMVHQYLLDHGIPAETRDKCIEIVKAWGKESGAEFIQWLVRSNKLATLYRRYFKAKAHSLIMRVQIEE